MHHTVRLLRRCARIRTDVKRTSPNFSCQLSTNTRKLQSKTITLDHRRFFTAHVFLNPVVKNAGIEMSTKMKESVAKVEEIIGYRFVKDPTLLWEALQAAGSPVHIVGGRLILDGNKKLAALGDAVADNWLWLNLYQSPCSLGQCDDMRQDLLNNNSLCWLGRHLGLPQFLVLSPGGGEASDYMVATMVEAIFGAVYLDGDMQALSQLMEDFGFASRLRHSSNITRSGFASYL